MALANSSLTTASSSPRFGAQLGTILVALISRGETHLELSFLDLCKNIIIHRFANFGDNLVASFW